MATDEMTAYRDRFPILADTTYLVSHSLGAMPIEVHEALAEFANLWQTRGIRAWADGWTERRPRASLVVQRAAAAAMDRAAQRRVAQ